MKTERTQKENATAIAKAIGDVRKVLNAVPIMAKQKWFDHKKFKATGLNDLIKSVCAENEVSEDYMRKIATWKS